MKKVKIISKSGRKRIGALGLALCILLTSTSLVSIVSAKDETAAFSDVTFTTQVGGTYDGMPLFDGEPLHLDAYLDAYFAYIGLEGAAVYATDSRGDYTLKDNENPNKGKTIPGAPRAQDNVQGVSTDFPTLNGMAMSWNKDLLSDIGNVWGNERINTVDYAATAMPNFNAVGFTVVSDLRINPLSGRIDESYSEDPYLTGTMIAEMAGSGTGVSQEANEDGFWTKAIVGTKHYSNYVAQWFRRTGSKDTSMRGLMEYQTRPLIHGVSDGAIMGTMTSYGRINGVPGIISPLINYMRGYAPYGFYTSPDAMAYNEMIMVNAYSNGFDKQYASSIGDSNVGGALALYQIANSTAGGSSFGTDANTPMRLVNAVRAGYYGVTEDDVYETARNQLTQLVRVGMFNERDTSGYPKNYPYLELSKGFTADPLDKTTDAHKAVANKASQESIVLLKNNNVLPLEKGSKVAVLGQYADARFKSVYSVGQSPSGVGFETASMSPLGGIEYINNTLNVEYKTVNKIVSIKGSNGNYLEASTASTGDFITATAADNTSINTWFEVYDWGQDYGYSFRSLANGRWINAKTAGGVVSIKNDGEQKLNTTQNAWDNGLNVGGSNMPIIFRQRINDDDTVSLIYNSYGGGFGGGFESAIYGGKYLTIAGTQLDVTSSTLGNIAQAETIKTATEKFVFETITSVDDIVDTVIDKDYAIVVVGAPSKHSAGEGADRSELAMSEEQYTLVDTVSAKYPGKTVVILKSNFPVEMGRIHSNDNVAAILYQPYGGAYDGHAMGQVLFGDATPTGRLTSTWYESIDAIPDIDSYGLAEGDNNKFTMDQLDPRFTKDYSSGDPAASGLTYMYTDADVTYPFGYGLSYSNFEYDNLAMGDVLDDGSFTMTVDLTNTGEVKTSEVVQLYFSNPNSAYGKFVPKSQLVSFEKVQLAPGELATITLSINPEDFAVWSTNDDKFIVEDGVYDAYLGSNTDTKILSTTVVVEGESISLLDLSSAAVNVFDKSFASSQVTYRELSKVKTIEGLKEELTVGGYYGVQSKTTGSWVAINQLDLNGATEITARVGSSKASPSLTLRLDSPTGPEVGKIVFSTTHSVTKTILSNNEADNILTKELEYIDVTIPVSSVTTGVHDLYIVFDKADVCIDSLLLTRQIDKTVLAELIATAKEKIKEDYTAESWAAFEFVLNLAQNVEQDDTVTQDVINTVADALRVSIDGLVATSTRPPTEDKPWVSPSALKILVGEAVGLGVHLGDAESVSLNINDTAIATISNDKLDSSGNVTVTGNKEGKAIITLGWSGGSKNGTDTLVSVSVGTDPISPLRYPVVFMSGEKVYTVKTAENGKPLSDWPSNPTNAGYRFDGWFTKIDGGGEEYTKDRAINSIITLYAKWTTVSTGGNGSGMNSGSSSNSKSSGGSSSPDKVVYGGESGTAESSTSSSLSKTKAVAETKQAVAETKQAVAAAKVANAITAVVKLRNPGTISSETIKAMLNEAGDIALKINADNMSADGKAVDIRISFDPSKVSKDFNLKASSVSPKAVAIANKLKAWFENNFMIIVLEHVGELGQSVEVAVKATPGLITTNLVIYSYNETTNSYKRIPAASPWVDANGYIHFNTNIGGSIIISDGPIVKNK